MSRGKFPVSLPAFMLHAIKRGCRSISVTRTRMYQKRNCAESRICIERVRMKIINAISSAFVRPPSFITERSVRSSRCGAFGTTRCWTENWSIPLPHRRTDRRVCRRTDDADAHAQWRTSSFSPGRDHQLAKSKVTAGSGSNFPSHLSFSLFFVSAQDGSLSQK